MLNGIWAALAAIIAFVISAAVGKFLIPALHKLKYGQTILDIGPSWHKKKENYGANNSDMHSTQCQNMGESHLGEITEAILINHTLISEEHRDEKLLCIGENWRF